MGTPKTKANNKYRAAHYDTISLLVPKGKKELIRECAEECGLTVNGLINRLIDEKLELHGYGAGPSLGDSPGRKRGGKR